MSDLDALAVLHSATTAATVTAYPAPNGRVLVRAVDADGNQVAAFTVPAKEADRFARGTLPAAALLVAAVDAEE